MVPGILQAMVADVVHTVVGAMAPVQAPLAVQAAALPAWLAAWLPAPEALLGVAVGIGLAAGDVVTVRASGPVAFGAFGAEV